MKPYFEDGAVTLFCGDAKEVLPTLAGVFAVVTDPPWGVKMIRGDSKIREAVTGDDVIFDPTHLLPYGPQFVIWGGVNFADKLPRSAGWLVWDKTFPECAHHGQVELAWSNVSRTPRIHREAYHGFMRQRDGWFHPMQKPVGLMRWCLGFTDPALTVLDPYTGSGAVLLAAKEMGRAAVGVEIEERFCEITARRLQATAEPLPLFVPDAPAPLSLALFDEEAVA